MTFKTHYLVSLSFLSKNRISVTNKASILLIASLRVVGFDEVDYEDFDPEQETSSSPKDEQT